MNSKQLIELEDQYIAPNYHPLDVVIARGEGVWVYDADGKKYLDCLSGYSAVNQGHCHPRLVNVIKKQASYLTLTSRAFRNNQLGPFCQEICNLTSYEMVLPMNTGAEAVETAIKVARKWAYVKKQVASNQAEIIVCSNNFHGRTTTIISFSTEPSYKENFGPFTPGFTVAEYGDVEAIAKAITKNTAAILFEPIQGEGGVVVPADGYLREMKRLCQEHNVLMIADEIQTGLGRTGALFACDHEQVHPDMMILGKALSGGFYPVSVVLASAEILRLFHPGEHGSTFSGNPLGMAVAREALAILNEENLIANAREQGQYMMGKLRAIASPYVEQVRGKGLLIGIVLKESAGGARRFCEMLEQKGILCKDTHENVLRLAPPLVIKREEIDWILEKIAAVLQA